MASSWIDRAPKNLEHLSRRPVPPSHWDGDQLVELLSYSAISSSWLKQRCPTDSDEHHGDVELAFDDVQLLFVGVLGLVGCRGR